MRNRKHPKNKAKRAQRATGRPAERISRFPLLPSVMDVTLVYNVRTQVSGSTFTVYNFDTLSLQALQPMYRDQLLALWSRYVVLGVTVESLIVNKSTTVDAECLSYYGTGSTVVALTFSQALEWKNTKRFLLSTSGNRKTIRTSRTMWNSSILPKDFIDDSDMWGSASSAPAYSTAEGVQFATAFYSADGTSSISVTLDRRIKFHVRLFAPAAVSNSLVAVESERPTLSTPAGKKPLPKPTSKPFFPECEPVADLDCEIVRSKAKAKDPLKTARKQLLNSAASTPQFTSSQIQHLLRQAELAPESASD